MGTLYDNIDKKKMEVASTAKNSTEVEQYKAQADNAMAMVDDIVLKNYLTRLSDMDVVPMQGDGNKDEIILFKINKMVYEKDEYATDKFISVVSAMTFAECSVCLIVDGKKDHTDFYLGIKGNDPNRSSRSIANTFKYSLEGQFPGVMVEDVSRVKSGESFSGKERLLRSLTDSRSISSCVGLPALKNSKGEYTNQNFIQGIDKFATAMQGKEYTAIILATNMPSQEIRNIRAGYEQIYTELSTMATQQLAYNTNESLSNALSRTKGSSDSDTTSSTIGRSTSMSDSISQTKGESKSNVLGKMAALGGTAMSAAAMLTTAKVAASAAGTAAATTAAAAAGTVGAAAAVPAIGLTVAGLAVLAGGTLFAKQIQNSETLSRSKSDSENSSNTQSNSHTENFSETNGRTATISDGKTFTLTLQNKHHQEVMKRIDKQLERIALCESTGLWSAGAYFISEADNSTAEIGATIYRSIMQGEQSGVEMSAINTWYNNGTPKYKALSQYISSVEQPIFRYTNGASGVEIPVSANSLVSSKELSMMVGLPRKSVPGLPVIELTSFAKEVVRLSNNKKEDFTLGCIYDQGVKRELNKVALDAKSLTQHTFVTGSTGCGKSNTIYYLLSQIQKQSRDVKFLIVEPAKGEYKDVFGNVNVYGTNPLVSDILRLNPFKFPKGVHVLEHIDKLIEIFNVCWPMYAAMPAVLKEATLSAYEVCGWDFVTSTNKYSEDLFPTFADLQTELVEVISKSAYSEEVKSNYQGSLVTRVKSLTNGLNGQIFCGDELGNEKLFDENVVVDLSRIGSQETKSLIMGLLIMRLSEYRSVSGITPNSPLRHITVLEEAHNILKKCSQEQSSEGSNVAGKSVEMISNAIAEMRTYGEGFVIVDQSPGAVDISAIRNTNTKIIMRLPEDSDRKAIGKAAAMKDKQIDEIAKLGTGVAVVYQNDWEEPVLCQIEMFREEPIPYVFEPKSESSEELRQLEIDALKFLLYGKITEENVEFDIDNIERELARAPFSSGTKLNLYQCIATYKRDGKLKSWEGCHFAMLSSVIADILSIQREVTIAAETEQNFETLNERLRELLHNRISDLPSSIEKPLMMSVMQDYSAGLPDREGFYKTWSKVLI